MECFIPTTTCSSNNFTVGAEWTLREVSEDAYLLRHGVSDTVRRKSPEDDCYVLMPMELGWQPPDYAVGLLAMLVARYWMASQRGSQPPPLSWVAKRFPVSRLCLLEGRKMATRLCVCVWISWHRRCTFKDDSSAPRVPRTKNDTFCVCYVHMCSHVVCHMAKDAFIYAMWIALAECNRDPCVKVVLKNFHRWFVTAATQEP